MILVTGSTGTGKSTTLAAMIDHLNHPRKLNIVGLEDPIEFVHRSKNSQVIQRELHTHIPTFAEGVRAAMREDPDVILVGEAARWARRPHGDDGRRDRMTCGSSRIAARTPSANVGMCVCSSRWITWLFLLRWTNSIGSSRLMMLSFRV